MQDEIPPIYWHYTTRYHLRLILQSGMLLPSKSHGFSLEVPAVWFSHSSEWEPTACKVLVSKRERRRLNKDETAVRFGGLVRIGVVEPNAGLTWQHYVDTTNVPPDFAFALALAADLIGSDVFEWRAAIMPVPQHVWSRIEVLSKDGGWQEA